MADWLFNLNPRRRSGLGALLVAGLGVVLLWTRLGAGLDRLSYDAQFRLTSRPMPTNLVLVKMDEEASRQLNQPRGAWDRALHARLIDSLRRGGAKLVVFDVFLTEPGHPATNALLAQAMAAHGRVVLAGQLEEIKEPGFTGSQPVPPREPFLGAAAAWGLVNLNRDPDDVVRVLFPGTDLDASLAWAAASAIHAPVTAQERKAFFRRARWLRYYGPNGALTELNYFAALHKPPEYFRDKVVFIGGRPRVLFNHERETDKFTNPFWDEPELSGMDIHATAFLNLLNGDWLTRLARPAESAVLIVIGLLLVFSLGLTPSRWVIPAALAGAFAVTVAAQLLSLYGDCWFGWATVVAAQFPAACVWTLGSRRGATPRARTPAIQVSGHTLLRTIGRGAYGEVWLARDVAGRFHAVKVIHRRRFPSEAPFEREFRGLQKFTPISRSHAGFVHILHLDRDDEAGYFYYVMEAGDDELTGQTIDPETYSARTLSRELTRCGRLPVETCLELGAALASALEHLHSHQLIHRDIKPSNIIFVNNVPKLADIGLVTDIGRDGREVSYIGTEGYLAPEGPGTPAADVYSLGKVIYEAAMGFSQEKFPELPTTLVENPASFQSLLELNEIIIRACAPDLEERYRTAAELRADLIRLRDRLMATKT